MKTSLIRTLIFFGAVCAANQLGAQDLQTEKPGPLVIIKIENSDKEVRLEPAKATNDQLKDLEADLIRSMSVFKGDSAVAKYGFAAKDGVVVITLKPGALKELDKYR